SSAIVVRPAGYVWEDALEFRAARRLQQYGGIVFQMRTEGGPHLVDVVRNHDPLIVRRDTSERGGELSDSTDERERCRDRRARDVVVTTIRVRAQLEHGAKDGDLLHTRCRG